MSKMKYLVTGGSGFLGSALVKRLVQEGHQVRVLDNLSRGATRRLRDIDNQFEFLEGDIRDPEIVKRATKGVDGVYHLAFVNGTEFFYQKPDLVLDVGIRGMLNVVDACISQGIGELILASSSEVYQTPPVIPTDETAPLSIPDPSNPRYSYAAGKITSELIALNYGREVFERVLIFRPHNVYGPDMGWEHVIPQFALRMKDLSEKSSGTIPFSIQGTGTETRSFIFIDDFIDGIRVMERGGEHRGIYHIGTTEEVEIREVAKLVGEYFGRQIQIIPGESPKGSTKRRCPDIQKLSKLGFKPQHSLRDGVMATCKWYDENADKRLAAQV